MYGHELRSLFKVGEGRVQVGVDAKAIEARCQAHNIMPYTGGEEYAKVLLEGDIHTLNAESFGCTRNEAKPTFYCSLYGGSAGKIAETLGCSKKRGEELFNQFWEKNTALKELKEALIAEFKSNGGKRGGYIRGLDGRKLFARSEHSLINLKFQSDGAILFKTAMVFLFSNWIPKKKLDAHLMISQHE